MTSYIIYAFFLVAAVGSAMMLLFSMLAPRLNRYERIGMIFCFGGVLVFTIFLLFIIPDVI